MDRGRCVCDSDKNSNSIVTAMGGCACEEGFFMLKNGCFPCDYIFPTCKSCRVTTENNLVKLDYTSAYDNSQYFLNCDQCSYGRYFTAADFTTSTPSKCASCTLQFDGCTSCTADSCEKCLQTHLLDETGKCQPCSKYMAGCLKCSSAQTCTLNSPI